MASPAAAGPAPLPVGLGPPPLSGPAAECLVAGPPEGLEPLLAPLRARGAPPAEVQAAARAVAQLCDALPRIAGGQPGAAARGAARRGLAARLLEKGVLPTVLGGVASFAVGEGEATRDALAILGWLLQFSGHAAGVAAMCRLSGTLKALAGLLHSAVTSPEETLEPQAESTLQLCLLALAALCRASPRNATALLQFRAMPDLCRLLAARLPAPVAAADPDPDPDPPTPVATAAAGGSVVGAGLQLAQALCQAEAAGGAEAFVRQEGLAHTLRALTSPPDGAAREAAVALLALLIALPAVARPVEAQLRAWLPAGATGDEADVKGALALRLWQCCSEGTGVTREGLENAFVALMLLLGATDLPGGHYPARAYPLPAGAPAAPFDPAAYSPELCARDAWRSVLPPADLAAAAVRHSEGYAAAPRCCAAGAPRLWAPAAVEPFAPASLPQLAAALGDTLRRAARKAPAAVVYDRTADPPPPPPGAGAWATPPLRFESRFEAGNLLRAVRVGEHDYDLVLDSDVNSPGHVGQWFFFEFSGTQGDTTYTLNIVNMGKLGSLFTQGQRPAVYSLRDAELSGIGWQRAPVPHVAYHRNAYRRLHHRSPTADPSKTFCSLRFPVHCAHAGDTVGCAYSAPYTYTELCRFLAEAVPRSPPAELEYCVAQPLATTLQGHTCHLLTITAPPGSGPAVADRPVVVISARVHPAETSASWMAEGVLRRLLHPTDPAAALLRSQFVWKVVPMLNPDGVVHGSTRCSLAGVDLNRRWHTPDPVQHPTVFALKEYIRHLRAVEGRSIFMYVDLHGHARQKNIFAYGCTDPSSSPTLEVPSVTFATVPPQAEFPVLLGQRVPFFSAAQSICRVQKARDTTARVVAWRELGITLSYTIEASLCGGIAVPAITPSDNSAPGAFSEGHFGALHLISFGMELVNTIQQFHISQPTIAEVHLPLHTASLPLSEVDPADESSDGSDG